MVVAADKVTITTRFVGTGEGGGGGTRGQRKVAADEIRANCGTCQDERMIAMENSAQGPRRVMWQRLTLKPPFPANPQLQGMPGLVTNRIYTEVLEEGLDGGGGGDDGYDDGGLMDDDEDDDEDDSDEDSDEESDSEEEEDSDASDSDAPAARRRGLHGQRRVRPDAARARRGRRDRPRGARGP